MYLMHQDTLRLTLNSKENDVFKNDVYGNIIRTADGAFVPADEGNRHYRQYLAWLAEGNTPQQPAADEVLARVRADKLAELDAAFRSHLTSGLDSCLGFRVRCEKADVDSWGDGRILLTDMVEAAMASAEAAGAPMTQQQARQAVTLDVYDYGGQARTVSADDYMVESAATKEEAAAVVW